MDPLRLQFSGPARVILVVAVPDVDDDVVGLEEVGQITDRALGWAPRGDHEPHGPRRRELRDQILERRRADRAFLHRLLHDVRRSIVRDDAVPVSLKPYHHVHAHPAESDESEFHGPPSSVILYSGRGRYLSVSAASRRPQARSSATVSAAGRWRRSARRPVDSSEAKSPSACASSSTPNENGSPGTAKSSIGCAVIMTN